MADAPTLTLVYTTFTIPGVHYWADAPDDVRHLRNLHRHLFHFKVAKQVFHDDRDVEFITLGLNARELIVVSYDGYDMHGTLDFKSTSCEMLARKLFDFFGLQSCEVSEDGENGAIITRSSNQNENA